MLVQSCIVNVVVKEVVPSLSLLMSKIWVMISTSDSFLS